MRGAGVTCDKCSRLFAVNLARQSAVLRAFRSAGLPALIGAYQKPASASRTINLSQPSLATAPTPAFSSHPLHRGFIQEDILLGDMRLCLTPYRLNHFDIVSACGYSSHRASHRASRRASHSAPHRAFHRVSLLHDDISRI
jgi:hypothetical protein